jgi:hypothetical protein
VGVKTDMASSMHPTHCSELSTFNQGHLIVPNLYILGEAQPFGGFPHYFWTPPLKPISINNCSFCIYGFCMFFIVKSDHSLKQHQSVDLCND